MNAAQRWGLCTSTKMRLQANSIWMLWVNRGWSCTVEKPQASFGARQRLKHMYWVIDLIQMLQTFSFDKAMFDVTNSQGCTALLLACTICSVNAALQMLLPLCSTTKGQEASNTVKIRE